MFEIFRSLDADVLFFIQENLRADFLDAVMKFFTGIGDYGIIWLLIASALLISPKTRRAGLDLILCLAVAALITNLIIKPVIARPRAFVTYPEIEALVSESSFSFPSGHACSSFASATALTLAFKGRGGWAYLPAAIISFSRLYVGVHYPSDVIFGAILGILLSIFTYKLSHGMFKGPGYGE